MSVDLYNIFTSLIQFFIFQMTFLRALYDLAGKNNSMLYQWLLPWLSQKPLEEALCEDVDASSFAEETEFRNTARSAVLRKNLSHITRFLCRRRGIF